MVAKRKAEPMNLKPTSMERTSDKEIVITRTFRAPAHIVFDAWTKPEYVSAGGLPSRGASPWCSATPTCAQAARTVTCSLAAKPSASRFLASTWRSRAPRASFTRRASSPCRGGGGRDGVVRGARRLDHARGWWIASPPPSRPSSPAAARWRSPSAPTRPRSPRGSAIPLATCWGSINSLRNRRNHLRYRLESQRATFGP